MRTAFLFLCFALATAALAQPPNDQCSAVVPFELAVGSTVTRTGTRTGATTTNDGVPTSILMTTLNVATVWEAFTTTTCSNVSVRFCGTPLPATTMWNFITTTCPADVPIYFSYANFGILCPNGQFGIQWYNLPAGTYYLPIYCTTAGGAYTVEFVSEACIPGPPNDDCSGAVPLTVNTTCQPTSGSVLNGTLSFPALACNGATGDANDDVWFSFVATAPAHTVTLQASGNGLDAVLQLFANSCDAANLVACADATFDGGTETLNATGLSVGTTYFVRAYHYYTALSTTPGFSICVTGDVGTAVPTATAAPLGASPTRTSGTVTLSGLVPNSTVRVLDAAGRTVHTLRSTGSTELLQLEPCTPGSYVVQATAPDGSTQRTTVVRE